MGRHGVRSDWSAVPAHVRAAVDELLGARVVATSSLDGGFSPGPAVRADLDDGRTVFIKAVSAGVNEMSSTMHRDEASVLASLGPGVPAPKLEGVVEVDDWIALVVGWVDGRHPDAADPGDVARLLQLLDRVAAVQPDAAVVGLVPIAERHGDLFGHWAALASDTPTTLDPWPRRHLAMLADVETTAPVAASGSHLLHLDVRTDNALLAASGPADDVLVDWPGATIGAPWVDLVVMLPSLHLDGAATPAEAFAASSFAPLADPGAVDAFVVALAGYFIRNSLRPSPPGLPTLRAFQAAQGEVACRWAAERLGLDP